MEKVTPFVVRPSGLILYCNILKFRLEKCAKLYFTDTTMISNERRWPSSSSYRQPLYQPYYERPQSFPPRPPVKEDTLETRELQVERKHFLLTLKENPRGRFLRVSEETNGRFNSIIIPAAGLQDFVKMLQEIVAASGSIPAKAADPQSQGNSPEDNPA